LVVKGKYVSVIKDLMDDKALTKTVIIKKGDISVIKPNVAHTMVFLEDTEFLNLVRGEREHENYGITHTIPYKLVDDTFRNDIVKNYFEFKNPNLKPPKTIKVTPSYQLNISSGDRTVQGPVSVGPGVDGFGVAMSIKLMKDLGLYNGDVVYFRKG
jgi:hypothetical protein